MAQVILCDQCDCMTDGELLVSMDSVEKHFCSLACAIEWLCIEEASFTRRARQ